MKKRLLLIMSLALVLSSCVATPPKGSTTDSSKPSEDVSISTKPSEIPSEIPSVMPSVTPSEIPSEIPSEEPSVVNKYLVTFKDEEGNVIESKMWQEGTIPTCSYKKTNNDEYTYVFLGWSKSLNGEVIEIEEVSKEVTYFAKVNKTKNQYTITYITNVDTPITPNTVDYGTSVSKPSDPHKVHYDFKNWTYESATGEEVKWPVVVTKNISVFANYTEKEKYTLSFVTNSDTVIESVKDYSDVEHLKPIDPKKEGYHFTNWSFDSLGKDIVTWPLTLTKDTTIYANYNEVVDIKGYLKTLVSATKQDPYSYIPETLREEGDGAFVDDANSINYDFNNFTHVSDINYKGYGDQWALVLKNIKESQRFYSVLTLSETALSASILAFEAFLDKNPSATASHEIKNAEYIARIEFKDMK